MRRNLLLKKTTYLFLIIFSGSLLLLNQNAIAQISQTFTSSGKFTVPIGVTEITVECWGAGGAGGGSTSNNSGGSGGGGGGYCINVFSVTPGQQINYTIGAGGTGSTGNGTDGGETSMLTLTATGGGGGGANRGTVGAGGTATEGTTNTNGNAGTVGGNSGGAGGAGANGGSGGTGSTNASGGVGTAPGGGGGGGERGNGNNYSGGNGASGQVRISWNPSVCQYADNTLSGSPFTPCINIPSNQQQVSNSFATHRYFVMDVIKGLNYQIYTCSAPSQPLKMVVYEEGNSSGTAIASSYTNSGNPCSTNANNVYLSFTSTISGQLRILINRLTDCADASITGLTVNVNVSGGSNTQDDQNASGTDSWIGHIYDGTNFNNYLGYYNQTETFKEGFGTLGTWPDNNNDDATCFSNINSNEAVRASLRDVSFSARYLMVSTKRGLYRADMTGDDGDRLFVDGVQVYSDWSDHSPRTNSNVLIPMSGNSLLTFEYYENGGQNVVGFNNLIRILANNLNSNVTQNICLGSVGSAISGDTFGSLPTGISLSGTGYQWTYSTTPTGTRMNISGATGAIYTPDPSVAPFNAAGTYYVFRNAMLRSTNNMTPNPYVATNESNAATVIISQQSSNPSSASASSSTICSGSSTTLKLNGGGGAPGEVIRWYSGSCGGTFVGNGNNLVVSPTTTTTYYGRYENDTPCNYNSACASITITVTPNATIGSIFGASPLCIGSTANYTANGVVSGGGTGAWSTSDARIATVDASGLVTGVANGSCDIIYTITGGCGGTQTARQSLTVESPGDPAVFGSGLWNVYVYQGNNIGLSGIYYKGYYTESKFSFSTTDRWSVDGSPDEATGYQGCAVTNDNHTFVYKREGFPSGMYQITIGHDDSYQLYIDGTLVSSSGAWDNKKLEVLPNSYTLTGTSRIEFRVAENGGESRGALTFTEVCTNPTDGGSISGDQSICYNSDPITFTSSSVASGETGDLEYKWQSSTIGSSSGFSDITPIATGLTYKAPTGLTQTTWYKRLSKVTCSSIWATTGESNILEITVKPQPTLASITAIPTSACTGSNITITVNGLLDGINTIGYDYTNNGSTTSTLVDLTASGGTATTTLNGLAAGIYQVKIKSITVNGCTTNFTTNNTVTWILNDFPVITNPGAQTACDSYTLPTITGTNLSGNQKYYNNSPALGGSVIIGPITSTQTVWIYDTNGTCSDEKSFLVTINPLPTVFNVTGSGTYCSAGSVGLSGSQIGVTYHLYENGVSTGSSVSGTGDAISFGNQLAGTYTVVATISNGDCPAQMTGSAVVTIGDTEKPAITKCLPDGETDCVKNLPAAITTIQGFIDAGGEVTDNCTAPMTVSYNDVITPGSPCEVRRTYTITDASTNTATCTQVFTITDTEAPVIVSVENLVVPPTNESCGAELTISVPTAVTENCGFVEQGAHFEYTIAGTTKTGNGTISDTFPEGITLITWTITDLCGHVSASKSQSVQVAFNITPISYDNGSNATGAGSGLQPMQTSTHEYFVDNKVPDSEYTYTWGLFESDGVTAVSSSLYTKTTFNAAHIKISFTTIPIGNYIISVIKTKTGITCKKQVKLPIAVKSNSSFDVVLDNLGNQCQAPSGNLTTISWNVTFPNVITEPFTFSYSIKLGGTVVASGNVANITYVGAIPMSGLSAGAQTSKSANSWAVVIYYSLYGISGNDLARTVEIEINATDAYQVSEPNRTNNIDDLMINQVPVITFE